jgi:ABC-type oligopeptide transport system substrate-binding subunit
LINKKNSSFLLKILYFLIFFLNFISCSKDSEIDKIGGVFSFCSKNRIHHFHPSLVSDESTSLVAHQIFEGLVKLNSKLSR